MFFLTSRKEKKEIRKREKAQIKAARAMLKKGFDVKATAQITELSIGKVKKEKKRLETSENLVHNA